MKITLEPTNMMVGVRDDLRLRVWKGADENGVEVRALVLQVAVPRPYPHSETGVALQRLAPDAALSDDFVEAFT